MPPQKKTQTKRPTAKEGKRVLCSRHDGCCFVLSKKNHPKWSAKCNPKQWPLKALQNPKFSTAQGGGRMSFAHCDRRRCYGLSYTATDWRGVWHWSHQTFRRRFPGFIEILESILKLSIPTTTFKTFLTFKEFVHGPVLQETGCKSTFWGRSVFFTNLGCHGSRIQAFRLRMLRNEMKSIELVAYPFQYHHLCHIQTRGFCPLRMVPCAEPKSCMKVKQPCRFTYRQVTVEDKGDSTLITEPQSPAKKKNMMTHDQRRCAPAHVFGRLFHDLKWTSLPTKNKTNGSKKVPGSLKGVGGGML